MKLFTVILLSMVLIAGLAQSQTLQLATPVGLMLHGVTYTPTTPEAPVQAGNGIDRVQLYPNPSSDIVHVTITLQQLQPIHLQLYNLLGQTVWSVDLAKTIRVETTVPVQQLANGIYLLQVTAGNTIEERKIVVAK